MPNFLSAATSLVVPHFRLSDRQGQGSVVASFDWREAGEAFRDAPAPGIVVAFWDLRRALTGETPCIQRRQFRRSNCTLLTSRH